MIGDTVPDVAESLTNVSKKYRDSSDQDIKKLARLSLYKVNAFEIVRNNNKPHAQEVETLAEDTSQLLTDFSDDDTVLATVATIFRYYLRRVDSKVMSEIVESLAARKVESESPKVMRLITDLVDEAVMANAKYSQLFENRWSDGVDGQRELLETSIELTSEPNSGIMLVKKVDAVAHWFEQEDQYDEAVEIYEAILKSADTYRNQQVTAAAKKRAEDGIKRSKLVGEKIDLSGLLSDGKEYSSKELKDKVVLIVFWSALNPESKTVVLELSKSSKDFQERGIQMLAVNIDPNLAKKAMEKVTKLAPPGVKFLFGKTDGDYSNNILQQCPSEIVPRILLVNQDGEVDDINIPKDEVPTQLDSLVGR